MRRCGVVGLLRKAVVSARSIVAYGDFCDEGVKGWKDNEKSDGGCSRFVRSKI